MKTILAIVSLVMIAGCLHDPNEAPANFGRDDLYCYHFDKTANKWEINGLSYTCPANTRVKEE